MIKTRSELEKLASLIKSKKYDSIRESISSIFKHFKQTITSGKFSKLLNDEQMKAYASQTNKASFHDLFHLNKDYAEYKESLFTLLSDQQHQQGNRRNANGEKKIKIKCLNIVFALIKLETLYKLNQQESESVPAAATSKRQRSKNSLEFSTDLLNVSDKFDFLNYSKHLAHF